MAEWSNRNLLLAPKEYVLIRRAGSVMATYYVHAVTDAERGGYCRWEIHVTLYADSDVVGSWLTHESELMTSTEVKEYCNRDFHNEIVEAIL